eukprot:230128-Alexandrium_andersonii.AAC.1
MINEVGSPELKSAQTRSLEINWAQTRPLEADSTASFALIPNLATKGAVLGLLGGSLGVPR